MKVLVKVLVSSVLLFVGFDAFAGAAVGYSCVGRDNFKNEAVVFDLLFSDSAPKVGYTNQSITITKKGGLSLEPGIVLQMFDAKTKNKCKKNDIGEFYLMASDFDMQPQADGEMGDYLVSFKIECGADIKFDVKGLCFFEY